MMTYTELIDHLVNDHDLNHAAVTQVAYTLATAKRLHAMQRNTDHTHEDES